MKFWDRFRPYLIVKQGIVNLKSGTSLRGILYRQETGYLVMKQVNLLADRGAQVKGTAPVVDGEVVVALSDIDFIQITQPQAVR